MNMAKKIVKVDEDAVRGYMVAAMADKPSRNDNAREEDTSSEVESGQEPVGDTVPDRPKTRRKRESDSGFRQKYLVNTPMSGRIQVYLNRKLYDEIKNYLHVIAPEVSISSYISNIIAEHIELNIDEITQMYKERFSPPKI